MDNKTNNKLKLGEQLLEMGIIDQGTLDLALEKQEKTGDKIGKILVDMGAIDNYAAAIALSLQLDIPLVKLEEEDILQEAISLVPGKIAKKYNAVPIRKSGKKLVVAFANPLQLNAIDELSFVTNMGIEPVVAERTAVFEALSRYYHVQADDTNVSIMGAPGADIEIVKSETEDDDNTVDLAKLEEQAELAPVVRFLNAIITDAITQRASDIHIEPEKKLLMIRYRIDGILKEAMKADPNIHAPLVSRVKIISNMDISVKRRPQDGKAQIKLHGRHYDLRASTIPTTFGEKVTLRILDSSQAGIGLADIGFSEENLKMMKEAIECPQGIVLVTGPTGSGKSSTLYACLNHLKSPTVNIITLEDPVEYEMAGINQVSINVKAGLTFASGLRTILRQDPDIVLIGEIRDRETAEIACKASQTGHLVLSTLHTNDAPASVHRLMDLGIESFMISSSVRAIVGQRLVRRICQHCKTKTQIPAKMAAKISSYLSEFPEAVFYTGEGCARCNQTGYSGRIAIHEVFAMTPEIKEVITPGVSSFVLKKTASKHGYRTLTLDGLDKARAGLTSVEEVFRVSPPEISSDTTESEKNIAQNISLPDHEETISKAVELQNVEKPLKVMVVDDDSMARKILQVTLNGKGFEVIEATNGAEGLRIAYNENPDFIITDYMMPELDGLGLVRALKSNPKLSSIPVIMLTSKDEAESEIELMDAGVDDYLTKPANAQRLLARMGRLIKNS